jgi:hypothetical protein
MTSICLVLNDQCMYYLYSIEYTYVLVLYYSVDGVCMYHDVHSTYSLCVGDDSIQYQHVYITYTLHYDVLNYK